MFSLKLLYLSILIKLFSLVLVNVDGSIESKSSDSIEEKVKNWIPLENPEVAKIYYFNITNLIEYMKNENEKLEVAELEPMVYESHSKPQLISVHPDYRSAIFKLNHNYSLKTDLMKNLSLNKFFTTVNSEVIEDSFSCSNKDSNQNLLDFIGSSFNYENRSLFELTALKYQRDFDYYAIILYSINAGNNPDFDGKVDRVVGNYEIKCLDQCYKSSNGSTDVRFQLLKNKQISLNEKKIDVLFFYRTRSFVFDKNYTFKGLNLSRYFLDETGMSMKSDDNKCFCGKFELKGFKFYAH